MAAIGVELAWVRSMQGHPVDDFEKENQRLGRRVYVCSVLADGEQLQKWLGKDCGTLIYFGVTSKGVIDLLAMPEDKVRALRLIQGLAKEHGLRIY